MIVPRMARPLVGRSFLDRRSRPARATGTVSTGLIGAPLGSRAQLGSVLDRVDEAGHAGTLDGQGPIAEDLGAGNHRAEAGLAVAQHRRRQMRSNSVRPTTSA